MAFAHRLLVPLRRAPPAVPPAALKGVHELRRALEPVAAPVARAVGDAAAGRVVAVVRLLELPVLSGLPRAEEVLHACVSGSAAGLGKTSSTTARAAAASAKDAADFFTGNATNSRSVGETGTACAVMANMAKIHGVAKFMVDTRRVRGGMRHWKGDHGALKRYFAPVEGEHSRRSTTTRFQLCLPMKATAPRH